MLVKKGFTLIEIMVVLVIIGISVTMTLLAFGDFGAGRKAVVSAELFVSYVKLVQQRAILEANSMGINVYSDGYETYRFDNHATWNTMPQNSLFHKQKFPEKITATLSMPTSNRNKRPDIIISPSSETTPFTIHFGTIQQQKIATVQGQLNGDITVQLANP